MNTFVVCTALRELLPSMALRDHHAGALARPSVFGRSGLRTDSRVGAWGGVPHPASSACPPVLRSHSIELDVGVPDATTFRDEFDRERYLDTIRILLHPRS
jgi:hypothetical protein